MLRDLPWRYFDFWLLGAVVLASAFGTTMIRSAVAGNEVLLPLINRQIYFALLGLVVIFVVAAIDYRYWMALYRPIFIVIFVLLFFLFLSAQAVFGAARWFQVGVLFLQPTEFAKIVLILLLARYFDKTQNDPRDLKWIIFGFLWVMALALWILLQPNLSNVVVMMVIFAVLLWLNGIQLKHLIQCINFEMVMVSSAWRAWPSIIALHKIIHAFRSHSVFLFDLVFRRDIPYYPVNPGFIGGVRINECQSKAFGFLR